HVTPSTFSLSLHDALPIFVDGHRARRVLLLADHRGAAVIGHVVLRDVVRLRVRGGVLGRSRGRVLQSGGRLTVGHHGAQALPGEDRKSTRLNSSHVSISYA